MTAQEVKRKLTAILSADAKGYSRLMQKDEVGTIQTLNTYKEVMANLIRHYYGRVVGAPGDNVLAEFASVVMRLSVLSRFKKNLRLEMLSYLRTAGWSFASVSTLGM